MEGLRWNEKEPPQKQMGVNMGMKPSRLSLENQTFPQEISKNEHNVELKYSLPQHIIQLRHRNKIKFSLWHNVVQEAYKDVNLL